jgi:hypothetical protein
VDDGAPDQATDRAPPGTRRRSTASGHPRALVATPTELAATHNSRCRSTPWWPSTAPPSASASGRALPGRSFGAGSCSPGLAVNEALSGQAA